jgi:nicotinamidase/pyrazinamidase
MKRLALGIIDAQRGFMPAMEGERLGVEGFGELPVEGGEQIIEPANRLIAAFARLNWPVFTTQDWHPRETAHFAEEPNFTTTWPVHCVAGTPGAELHPDIKRPGLGFAYTRFIKGFEPLERGEDDTSYSGYNAVNQQTGETLPDWLKRQQVSGIVMGGLALDYCVRASALDIRQRMDLPVTVVTDATRGIADPTIAKTLEEFTDNGIQTTTIQEFLAQMR